ncbi:MAG: hypothetical protein QXZ70_08845 [Candidatus Bathyarchaeia archaeon]
MQKKNLAKTAIVAGLLFILAYALAAQLTISEVGFVGSGTKDVSGSYEVKLKAVPTRVTGTKDVYVNAIEIKCATDLPEGSKIFITILGASGAYLGSADTELTDDLTANHKLSISVTPANTIRPDQIQSYEVSIAVETS